MEAYGLKDYNRCCAGHDPGSKKFDRAQGKRRRNTPARANAYRSAKKAARAESRAVITRDLAED